MKRLNFISSPETIQIIKKNSSNSDREKFKMNNYDKGKINKKMTTIALKKRKEEQNKFLDNLLGKFKLLDSRLNKKLMLGVIENQTAEIVNNNLIRIPKEIQRKKIRNSYLKIQILILRKSQISAW